MYCYTSGKEWFKVARQKKEPGQKYVRQNISMEPEQMKQLVEYCQKEERSISWVIRQALTEYLVRNGV